jgi:hypothetical protein
MFGTCYFSEINEHCVKCIGRDYGSPLFRWSCNMGATIEEHNQKLAEVFDRLRVQSLELEPDEFEFLRKEIYFGGYKVTADGVAMDERSQP